MFFVWTWLKLEESTLQGNFYYFISHVFLSTLVDVVHLATARTPKFPLWGEEYFCYKINQRIKTDWKHLGNNKIFRDGSCLRKTQIPQGQTDRSSDHALSQQFHWDPPPCSKPTSSTVYSVPKMCTQLRVRFILGSEQLFINALRLWKTEKRDVQTHTTPILSFLHGAHSTSTNPLTHISTHTNCPLFRLCVSRLALPFNYLLFVILLKAHA